MKNPINSRVNPKKTKKLHLTEKWKKRLKTLIIMKTSNNNVGSQSMILRKYPLTMNR
jgi:hypothetical protein